MKATLKLLRMVGFMALAFGGCDSQTGGADAGEQSDADAIEPMLYSLQAKLFTPRCSNASCHGGNNPVRGLNLSEGNTWDSVFEKDASVDGWKYVVPSEVESSLLYQIVVRELAEESIRQMPPGLTLDPEAQEALRQWIENGAANN